MKIKKILFVILGSITLVLGSIGIVLPILPTTPLYLLTLIFYAKGSDRFHNWFVSTRLYSRYLEAFVKTRSMTNASKAKAIITITILIAIAMYFSNILYARIILGVVWIAHVLFFLFKIQSVDKQELQELINNYNEEHLNQECEKGIPSWAEENSDDMAANKTVINKPKE